ncbi:MAG: hypothetical protein CVT71_02115 [Alphaproteobacteria bacterium HGW-Alphaproteobacteria-10]|nr:MAG: hypothetical protein CVT71_02115 [Alphaproteobacteria bacterium HGW-Alphaproteobacteria-10]
MAAPAAADPLRITETAPLYQAEVRFSAAAAALPALDARLRADAATTLDAFKAWAANNDDPARPYDFVLEDAAAFVSARYVSLVRTVYFYTGGAHGNTGVQAMTWDAAAQDFVGIDAFVTAPQGLEALSRALRAAVADQVHGGAIDDFWRDSVDGATAPTQEALRNFTLVADAEGRAAALDFHYAPYEVASYADGAPVIRVDLAVFAAHLTPEGAALFGR